MLISDLSLDSQSVVDIFLNYDCDLSLSNIYGRLVNDLSRIGQGRQAVELGATPNEQKLIRAKVSNTGSNEYFIIIQPHL